MPFDPHDRGIACAALVPMMPIGCKPIVHVAKRQQVIRFRHFRTSSDSNDCRKHAVFQGGWQGHFVGAIRTIATLGQTCLTRTDSNATWRSTERDLRMSLHTVAGF